MALTGDVKLSAAFLLAEEKAPYFITALSKLVRRKAPGLGTFAVSRGMILLYDPAVVEEWTVTEIGSVLIHEILHVIRDHDGRCTSMAAHPRVWNYAADAEINDDLKHLELPGKHITPSSLGIDITGKAFPDNLLAEDYYNKIRQEAEKLDQHCAGAKGEGGKAKGEGEGGDKPQAGNGWCGGAAGRPVPDEPKDGDQAARSEVEIQQTRIDTASAIKEHAKARGIGSVPAGLLVWADEMLKPAKVRWQDKLKRRARAAVAFRSGMVDYTFTRPARRQHAVGMFMHTLGYPATIVPSMHAPMIRAAIAIDTSGSMGAHQLLQAASEANAVLRALGTPVTFLSCDAEVHAVKEVRTVKELCTNMKGGGGTDFRPVFAALDTRKRRPDVLIFITDGAGPAPDVAPSFSVIWLIVDSAYKPFGSTGKPVTYGEFIDVTTE